jgi:GNAT superfamily N-acetyltransferase
MNWYKRSQTDLDLEDELNNFLQKLRDKYPLVKLEAWIPQGRYIELASIEVRPDSRGKGVGSKVMGELQNFAREVGLAITLRPAADRGKKEALERFYRSLGFRSNRGRDMDYELSSPFSSTMYWKPGKGKI